MEKPLTSSIPTTPGVYLYKDEAGRVLYVGKAKNLRKRVLSYFRERGDGNPKTKALLAKANSLETMATATEKEAFLLEASLIKKHRPRYNIVLRDDKDYVLFRLDQAKAYPKLEVVRRARPGKNKTSVLLFGPFSSAGAARETWKAIHHVFPLRRCSDRMFANRARPCLYHHMGQCLGPCCMPVSEKDYAALVHEVTLFLEGRSQELADNLRKEMEAAAERMDFERAAVLRDRVSAIESTIERQAVVLPTSQDIDVVGMAAAPGGVAMCILFVRKGVLLDKRCFFWPGIDLDEGPTFLTGVLLQFYQTGAPIPDRIIAPWMSRKARQSLGSGLSQAAEQVEEMDDAGLLAGILSETKGSAVRLVAPRGPAEDTLVSLAATNARESIRDSQPDITLLLADALGASGPISRVEAVDVSHTGGTNTRVGMVVFQDGQPLKSDYRTYTVEAGGDDYLALTMWATRRAAAGEPWPDLVLVDGGRGQLQTVSRAFAESGITNRFTLAGIAKARDEFGRTDRTAGAEDRIFLPGRSNPLNIKPASPVMFYLQRVRDTVHDYVLRRHRQARTSQAMAGEVLRIPGVGPKTARLLWDRFGSLAAMANASLEDIAGIEGLGPKRARVLHERIRLLSPSRTTSRIKK